MTPGALLLSNTGYCSCSCPGACSQECEEPKIAPLTHSTTTSGRKTPQDSWSKEQQQSCHRGFLSVFFPNLANTVAEVGKSKPYGSGLEDPPAAGDPEAAVAAAAAAAAAVGRAVTYREAGAELASVVPPLPAGLPGPRPLRSRRPVRAVLLGGAGHRPPEKPGKGLVARTVGRGLCDTIETFCTKPVGRC